VATSAGVAAAAEAGGMAAAPGARPAAPVVEPPEERERRFLGRLATELQRVWPTQDRAKVRVGSLVMVEDANGLPGRYGPDVVSIGRRHPLVRGALDRFDEDPVPLWILVSFLATQANLEFTRITDEHERAMQAALVERLAEWSSSGR
ncbi:MAG: hypothetical protein GYA57_09540, partial [Myxococcales bacterium]|nr:hypothetical protein [Myxococcales bacterium]